MAASPTDRVFVYPDPSLLGLYHPPQQPNSSRSTDVLELNTSNSPFVPSPSPPHTLDSALHTLPGRAPVSAPPFALDPALLTLGRPATAPVSAPASGTGRVPEPRLSAAGLQPFPVLRPGLEPPVELTKRAQIDLWKHNLLRTTPLLDFLKDCILIRLHSCIE